MKHHTYIVYLYRRPTLIFFTFIFLNNALYKQLRFSYVYFTLIYVLGIIYTRRHKYEGFIKYGSKIVGGQLDQSIKEECINYPQTCLCVVERRSLHSLPELPITAKCYKLYKNTFLNFNSVEQRKRSTFSKITRQQNISTNLGARIIAHIDLQQMSLSFAHNYIAVSRCKGR